MSEPEVEADSALLSVLNAFLATGATSASGTSVSCQCGLELVVVEVMSREVPLPAEDD